MSETRALLDSRLATLHALLERIEVRRRGELSPDSEEQSQELSDVDVIDTIERRTLSEIKQVLDAIGRVEHGRWGMCSVCGEQIPPARMKAMPTAEHCMEHA